MTQSTAQESALPRRQEYMTLDEMQTAERNPKGHDGPRINGAISRFGFLEQAVLDERTGRMVSGHGRLEQLMEMRDAGQDPPEGIIVDADGQWRWPVIRGWSSRSDTEAEAVGVTLNRLTEAGGWDDLETLADILDTAYQLDPALLDVTGYSSEELDTLLALTATHDDGGEDDESVLNRTDRQAWPRISAQVPPDIYEQWQEIPGNDDSDRVMVVLRAWQRRDENAARAEATADLPEEAAAGG